MRNFTIHRSAVSRYMGRAGGFKRSSAGRRNTYKLGNSQFKQYLQETKNQLDDLNESENTEETETRHTRTLSKYSANKAASSKNSASKFNTGISGMEDSTDTFAELFGEDEFDFGKAYDAAVKFAESYNNTYASIRNSSNSRVSNKASYISKVADIYGRSLDKAGMSVNKNGELTVDKERFMSSDVDDLKGIFAKRASFAAHIKEETDSIQQLSKMSADTYSAATLSRYTSAMSGSLFNSKL